MTTPDRDSAADELAEAPSLGVPARLAPGPSKPHPVRVSDALGFALDGPDARRNLWVASLWLLVPIGGWLAVQGWASEASHRLLEKHPAPVPRLRLRDFGSYAARGWPAGFVELTGLGLLGVLAAGLFGIANVVALTAGMAAGSPLVLLLVLVGSLLVTASMLGLVSVLWNAMLTRAELTERLGDALAIADAWRESRPVRGRTALAYLTFLPLAAILLGVGSALCGIGLLPAYVAVKLAGMHLRWQLYEQRVHRGGRALPARTPRALPSERALVRQLPRPGRGGAER